MLITCYHGFLYYPMNTALCEWKPNPNFVLLKMRVSSKFNFTLTAILKTTQQVPAYEIITNNVIPSPRR